MRAAGGNPLFVHEMVAMAAESGSEVTVPPTLQALLAARLDQLKRPERSVLERGAVEGEVFHRGSVQALAGDEQVTPRLAALVRKQLIRPDRTQLPGDDGFRFRHLLIRDAAYEALPKAVRAELHARFARWLEENGQSLVELDEILAYHLDQACRYRDELGLEPDPELVGAARARLRETGLRASSHLHDYEAAARAFARALELAGDEVDTVAGIQLAETLLWAGRGEEALEQARRFAAHAAGDRAALLCARLTEAMLLTFFEPEGATERLEALVAEAEPEFTAAGDEFGLYVAAKCRGQVANMRGRLDELVAAYDDVAERAQRFGLPIVTAGWSSTGRIMGTASVQETLAWFERLDEVQRRNPFVRGSYAQALAMAGRADEARAVLNALRDELLERGSTAMLAVRDASHSMPVAELTGDLEEAAAFGESGCRGLEERGELTILSTFAGYLARVLYRLDRLDEGLAWAERGLELGASDDALTQMVCRQAKALVAARRGQADDAVRLAREAVDIALDTDFLNRQGDAFFDLGEVLALSGDQAGAADAYARALDCYERKGNVVSADRTRGAARQLRVATS